MDAVAGEEVLPAAHVAGALANRDEIEDRADVAEERVVTLARERAPTAGDAHDALRGERTVVRGRARADVVRRRRSACDDLRPVPRDPRDRERLRGVAEEERAGLRAELEPVRHVRARVPVRVDLEVVARVRRERVPVRPCRRILAGDDVGENRDGVRLVRAAERVEIRQVRRRVLRDQRRLAVARSRTASGAECRRADDGGCTEQADDAERDDPSSHHCSSRRWSGPALVRALADRGSATEPDRNLRRRRSHGSTGSSRHRVSFGRAAGPLADAQSSTPTSRTRPWSRSSRGATRPRSRSSTTGSSASPTASRSASCATSASRRTPCRKAFLDVWRNAAAFRAERAKASTWILTLVHRRAVDLVRREERRRAEPLTDDLGAPEHGRRHGGGGVASLRARARAGRAQAAPGRPARGARARVLRRVLPVRARRAARRAARHHQEQDVRRACATARAPRRFDTGRIMEAGIHELTAGYALDALDSGGAERLRGAPRGLRALPARSSRRSGRRPRRSRSPRPGRSRAPALRERILADVRAEPPQNVVPFEPRRRRARAGARRGRGGRGGRRARSRALGVESVERARRDARGARTRAGRCGGPRRSRRSVGCAASRATAGSSSAPDGEAVLVVDGLGPAPAGKTYELWVVSTRRGSGACRLVPRERRTRGRRSSTGRSTPERSSS